MAGLTDADHAEEHPEAATLLIAPVSCPVVPRTEGAPKLSGGLKIVLAPDSLVSSICDAGEIEEGFFCNYELNPIFRPALEESGMRFTGFGPNGEARVAELAGLRFYIATLFLPQLNSAPGRPHSIIIAFLQAAMTR